MQQLIKKFRNVVRSTRLDEMEAAILSYFMKNIKDSVCAGDVKMTVSQVRSKRQNIYAKVGRMFLLKFREMMLESSDEKMNKYKRRP